jgi:hypothetical protein
MRSSLLLFASLFAWSLAASPADVVKKVRAHRRHHARQCGARTSPSLSSTPEAGVEAPAPPPSSTNDIARLNAAAAVAPVDPSPSPELDTSSSNPTPMMAMAAASTPEASLAPAPAPAPAPPATGQAPASYPDTGDFQADALAGHNLARAAFGAPPLVWDDDLAGQAQGCVSCAISIDEPG